MKPLRFEFDGSGEWEAHSFIRDDGSLFTWRIGVCDDGTFDVSESSAELTNRKECFSSFADAVDWCNQQEMEASNDSLANTLGASGA